MDKAQFGMIGLGTMGRNFLLNVGEKGFSGIGYNRDPAKLQLLFDERQGFDLTGVSSLPEFVAGMALPRRVMLLVPAGPAVDSVIEELLPHLQLGDMIIDGGNSHFADTERREKYLTEKGIEFIGVGVSGGEEGARHGASIMIGGNPAIYEHVRPIFEAASAKVNGEPCAAHVGNSSAGHFVKMVHNGIEYGLMELICEAYDLLRNGYGMNGPEISALFREWDDGELNSFLIDITATVLSKKDSETGTPLVELILDTAGQKGTGKWTSQVALDLGVPIPTIDSSVTMRQLSARKENRVKAAAALGIVQTQALSDDRDTAVASVRKALHLAFIVTYAQGISLLRAASAEKNYELDLVEIAKIWRGGCIIRARLLEDIRQAYSANPELGNLLMADNFRETIKGEYAALNDTVAAFGRADIPCMTWAATLNYLKAYASERLPANLLQGQRDFFGAHTYQRIDKEGTFHTPDWDE
ncbi:MAG TPA: NADP-dependent phosphogluconate dehydrogenase [Pyrinomonadaceae bacterium]|nr:NADP-dependent phosphogluconate dehydrogenase [Pyrinomonadaceae bacterium]